MRVHPRPTAGDQASATLPITVLHCRSSAASYGPERALMMLVEPLAAQGIESRLLALYRQREQGDAVHPLVEQARELGLRAEQIHDPGPFSIGVARRMARRVHASGAQILHTHDYKTNVFGGLASRRPDRGLPWVATVHLHTQSSRRLRVYRAIDLFLLRLADRVVTVSREQRRMLLDRGVDRRRVVLIPNVIDAGRFRELADAPQAVRARLGLPTEARVVTLVGRLAAQKGLDDFLEAARLVHAVQPETRFLIAGHGPERERLEGLSRALGLGEALRFLGYRADVASLMAASDLLVMPSHDEGLPIVLLEAMAMGLPIVATRVGGIPDLVRDGETGLLVAPGAPRELADEALGLLADRETADSLGRSAQRYVDRQCSPERATRRLAAIYRTVLAERGQ
ncbi:MAG: glycosyltransferase family 4 protein [Caldilineae bacterium]|nr:glycosyltransferase family 4 protein [Chloroflexota bacterium]MCB9177314.1 glycosyltransferase family 4 protein [Caldilineae bacterium]